MSQSQTVKTPKIKDLKATPCKPGSINKSLLTPCRRVGLPKKKKTPSSITLSSSKKCHNEQLLNETATTKLVEVLNDLSCNSNVSENDVLDTPVSNTNVDELPTETILSAKSKASCSSRKKEKTTANKAKSKSRLNANRKRVSRCLDLNNDSNFLGVIRTQDNHNDPIEMENSMQDVMVKQNEININNPNKKVQPVKEPEVAVSNFSKPVDNAIDADKEVIAMEDRDSENSATLIDEDDDFTSTPDEDQIRKRIRKVKNSSGRSEIKKNKKQRTSSRILSEESIATNKENSNIDLVNDEDDFAEEITFSRKKHSIRRIISEEDPVENINIESEECIPKAEENKTISKNVDNTANLDNEKTSTVTKEEVFQKTEVDLAEPDKTVHRKKRFKKVLSMKKTDSFEENLDTDTVAPQKRQHKEKLNQVPIVEVSSFDLDNIISKQSNPCDLDTEINEDNEFTSTPEEEKLGRNELLKQVGELEERIKSKKDQISKLKQAQIYQKIHNIDDLKSLFNVWKQGCIAGLNDLLPHLETHANINMATLLKNLNIPPNVISISPKGELL